MTDLDFARFDALTFDCYGTLIDWESGLSQALHDALDSHGVAATDDALLEAFARHEAKVESGPYVPYRGVLAYAVRRVGAEFGVAPSDDDVVRFAESVGDWPAFPDSAAALERLKKRFRLGVITNCDDDLFTRSNERLGVEFDWIVTAEQVGSYKPNPRNFEYAFETIDMPRDRILHVAQSLFHDHVPAKRLGMSTVWINRRHDRPGAGATSPAEATPDLEMPDMASFADRALS